MNILVLGGNGFIGKNLLKSLVKTEHKIFSFDLHMPVDKVPDVHYMTGDFFDDYVLKNAIHGMNIIYHAICTMNPGNSNDKYIMGYERDLIQTIKLCDMIQETGAKMVFLSSGGTVYGKQEKLPISEDALAVPINHYGSMKLACENSMRVFNYQNKKRGIKTGDRQFVIARIANPYGPGQDYKKGVGFIDAVMKHALHGEKIEVWGDGTVVRDYIYIQDVCEILKMLGLVKIPYSVVNVSSGRGTSQNEILEIMSRYCAELTIDYQKARSVDADAVILDNTRMCGIYRKPLVSLQDGLKLYYEFLGV